MIGKFGFRVVSILLVFMLALAFALPTSAAGEAVSIDAFDTSVCTPGSYPLGIVTHVNGAAAQIRFTLVNESKSTSSSFSSPLLSSGTWPFDIIIPTSTESGDSMRLTIELLDSGSAMLASAALAYPCGQAAGAGPDMGVLTEDAVVGRFVANTAIMQTPGVVLQPEVVMEVGKTLWVLGVDETGMYYKVLLSGQPFWVPVGSMGPNYDEVWNGTPLPITTVY